MWSNELIEWIIIQKDALIQYYSDKKRQIDDELVPATIPYLTSVLQ